MQTPQSFGGTEGHDSHRGADLWQQWKASGQSLICCVGSNVSVLIFECCVIYCSAKLMTFWNIFSVICLDGDGSGGQNINLKSGVRYEKYREEIQKNNHVIKLVIKWQMYLAEFVRFFFFPYMYIFLSHFVTDILPGKRNMCVTCISLEVS